VRARLGYQDLPNSYTKFLIDSWTGWNVSQRLVDVLTLVLLILAFGASLYFNLKGRSKRATGRGKNKTATA
jgi:hypothetical protein